LATDCFRFPHGGQLKPYDTGFYVRSYLTRKPGADSRRVAYLDGMVFRGFQDGHRAAFDATTGKQIWRFDLIPSGKEPGGGQVLLASKSIDIFGPALDYFDVIGIDANNRHR
jgi:outer membrane protein assembly factor BamB